MQSTRVLLRSCGKACDKLRNIGWITRAKKIESGNELDKTNEIVIETETDDVSDHQWNIHDEMSTLEAVCDFLDFVQVQTSKDHISHKAHQRCCKVSDLLKKLFKNDTLAAAMVTAVIYLQRIHELGVEINSRTLNSLVLVSVVVASKFLEDGCPTNAFWAEIGRVSVVDMNMLERQFLSAIRFRLFVSTEEFDSVCTDLLAYRAAPERGSSALAARFLSLDSSSYRSLAQCTKESCTAGRGSAAGIAEVRIGDGEAGACCQTSSAPSGPADVEVSPGRHGGCPGAK
mmetsp:Transcript_65596/g.175846  ORF Transcript_65596/g.175846 Transcript_65596/m.175846 type:complete len:287 (-) Transcript_65596:529-1389(-)|eukprot:CAMPEP_0113663436 /NCGR_PEP_ID=MMETSP0038_2-20120614/1141_1 /TAXON_ID=2898 /ORGANISM="Cryptomonas paramecium" /LENGTH=286 /DNA_ID=CAMNT_0000578463 /DNA_START=1 /DNA_END=861 /DNA_ORIENTATION=- /assembly_acc=CAM_ASM_000170